MIADSNIFIYAQSGSWPDLKSWIAVNHPAVSAVTKVEVFGYHRISPQQLVDYPILFADLIIHPVDDAVIAKAIEIRQLKRLSLGDALIAATALIHGVPLATANEADYANLPGLHVVNPMRP